MRTSVHRIWMSAVLAVVLAFSLAFLAEDATKFSSLIRAVDMWSLVALQEDIPGIFTEVDTRDFAAPPYPLAGDSLLTVDGAVATRANYFAVFNTKTRAGIRVPIRFRRGDTVSETEVVTRTIPGVLKAQYVTLFSLRVILTLGLVLVGFWAFLRGGNAPAVRTLALFCFSMAVSQLLYVRAAPDAYATFMVPWRRTVFPAAALFAGLAPVLWLRLGLQFPTPRPWYERHWGLVTGLLVLPLVVLLAVQLVGVRVPLIVPYLYGGGYLAGGFYLYLRSYRRARDPLTRRQVRLILLGMLPSVLVGTAVAVITLVAGRISNLGRLYLLNLNCLALLFVPITFAYAVGRYRLLEIEGRLRRGTRFAAVNLVLLAVFGGLLYGFGAVILRGLRIEAIMPTLALGLLLALVFGPAQTHLRAALERRFYPERLRLRELLRTFLETAGRRLEPERFWPELTRELAAGLGAERVVVFLCSPDGLCREPEGLAGRCPEPPAGFWAKLRGVEQPIPLDELVGSGRVRLDPSERVWVETCRLALIVPLPGSTRRIGHLLLGRKAEDEDYSPHELYLLGSFAAQIGLAAENLQLLGDRMERQRLEEQLSVARRIQEGLLPASLAHSGIEAAARIRFCLEVAGDFYDLVPLRDGRVLFAIGDVAGKGVGAALLMANVQASLRAMRNTGLSLPETVAEVNALVHQNTPENLFITLFVGVYDPANGDLVFVNAGHDPPILARSDGTVRMLKEGGLILGVLPGTPYAQGSVRLDPGDLVLLFTDGVTEARNRANEEFGPERLAALVPGMTGLPLESGLDAIEREVRGFTGRAEMDDDFTLLAVRVTGRTADAPGTRRPPGAAALEPFTA